MSKPAVCIQTDFGVHWGAPSSMHGVIHTLDPEIKVSDITHLLEKFSPWSASYCLFYTMPTWPAGTIFVSVVDPGVGTPRRACVAKTARGQYIVTPDNGTLTHVKALHGIAEVREIDETINRRPDSGKFNTFHGRDLFAYCAGRLAAGQITFEQVGNAYPIDEIVAFPLPEPVISPGFAQGYIANADAHFGGISTSISIEDFERAGFSHGETLSVLIEHDGRAALDGSVLYHRSFGFVKMHEPIIYNGLAGFIALSEREGDLIARHGLKAGPDWIVSVQR